MASVVEIMKRLEQAPPELREIFVLILEEMERLKDIVTKREFNELKEIVRELAEAQKRTEQRVEELAEAQKRTEQRVEELAEAQKQSEYRLTRLEATVQELAEAQKRTEKRVEELAEAQKRTERRLEQLAEAQRRTEDELKKLIADHKETRRMLGGLSDTVGYSLEDKVLPYMERFALSEFGIVAEDIGRKNIVYPDGEYDELNIFVEGKKNGAKICLVGECKAQLGKKDIKKFKEKVERVRKFLNKDVFSFIVGYTISPDVESYLKRFYPEIRFYYSYHFELKYRSRSSS